jgi:hypothetical protein
MERFLLEAHTTKSQKKSMSRGLETIFDRDEFTLTTIICTNSGEREPWRSGSALLVELRYDSSPWLDVQTLEKIERKMLQISDAQYLARFIGAHENSFGEWDWAITATEVPISLAEETVKGSLSISGREFPMPARLRTAELDEYWANRIRIIDQ